jgi:hypothetical protein
MVIVKPAFRRVLARRHQRNSLLVNGLPVEISVFLKNAQHGLHAFARLLIQVIYTEREKHRWPAALITSRVLDMRGNKLD